MKKIIIFSILVNSCISTKQIRYWGTELYNKQKIIDHRYADAIKFGRDSLQIKGKLNLFNKSDTLFLIERIDEASLQSNGVIWDNNKFNVILFEENEIVHTKKGAYYKLNTMEIKYNDWHDPLKEKTEKFDTLTKDISNILGGNRTFFTQIIKRKFVRTYFFEDNTVPKDYFEKRLN